MDLIEGGGAAAPTPHTPSARRAMVLLEESLSEGEWASTLARFAVDLVRRADWGETWGLSEYNVDGLRSTCVALCESVGARLAAVEFLNAEAEERLAETLALDPGLRVLRGGVDPGGDGPGDAA